MDRRLFGGGGYDRGRHDDRHFGDRRFDEFRRRSPPRRSPERRWSPPRRNSPPRRSRSPRRDVPYRDDYHDRQPPPRRFDGPPDHFHGDNRGGPWGYDDRRGPPSPVPPKESDWVRHLWEPGPGDAYTILAGCKLPPDRAPELEFWGAVQVGDVGRLETLLDRREEIDQKGGPYGCTALGWAALSNDVALAKLFLSRKADPNARARKGSCPLHMAAWNGDHFEV
jgi:hypothetical protein